MRESISLNESAPLSAIPPVWARATGVVIILLAGLMGGVLGYLIVDAVVRSPSGVALGFGILIGSVATALGAAVVIVLALRAMGEWRTDS